MRTKQNASPRSCLNSVLSICLKIDESVELIEKSLLPPLAVFSSREVEFLFCFELQPPCFQFSKSSFWFSLLRPGVRHC